jgi:PAS domain S-box-containing protein
MLYFGDRDSLALDEFQAGIRSRVERGQDASLTIYTESFDEEALGRSALYAVAMEQFLREKYADRGIDVVVPVGEYPLEFIQTRRKSLFPDAKLLYLGLGTGPQRPIPNSTGMVLPINLGPTVEIALAQNPGTRHVMLIAGATAVDRGLAQLALASAQKSLQEKHQQVDLRILTPGTIADNLKAVAALPPGMISVFVSYFGDSSGQTFVPARILPSFSGATNRPIYAWFDAGLRRGIVGGNLLDFEENGALFGDLMIRAIHTEDPGTIPVIISDISSSKFDWKQMARWGIPLERIPPGSTVINRDFTVWELYKWQILGLIGLVLLQAVLIVSLFRLTINQRRQARNLAERRRVQALIARCAAAFINLPAELFNNELEISFQEVLEFFDLDRINLFEFSPVAGKLRLACTRGTVCSPPPLEMIDLHQLPWTADQFQQGAPILATSLDDLPPEATALRGYLKAYDIRSFAAFPLMRGKVPYASISFSAVRSSRVWEPDLVLALRTIADIFGSALERKYAEEAASGSRDRLTGIVESAMDAIVAIDEQHRIVVFNATAEKMFGCSADEALDHSLERFIPQQFRARHVEHIARFAEAGVTNRSMGGLRPLTALRTNGQEFPIEASISQVKVGDANLFTVIVRDVTDRQQAEQKLRESNDLNVSILQSLRGHLAVLDSEGRIVVATVRNPEFVALNGINAQDIRVGESYLAKCRASAEAGDQDAAAALAGIQALYDAKTEIFEMEYCRKSGTEQRWFSMSATPLGCSPGKGVVISHEDVTLRKRHEQAIRELSGRLINAQEQERSRIARELHDDINQQVAMLAIELQQLKLPISGESSGRNDRIDAIWRKTHALSLNVQRLSHRLHSAKLDHLGIVAALRGLCKEISEQSGIEIEFQFRQVPAVMGSDVSLSIFRVAQESLHNITKHAHAQKVRVELVGAEESLVMRVSDDGVGFDPDASEHKAGLGMISMRERIRSVGGAISFFSGPSLGTKVETIIPLSHESVATATAP